MKLYVGNLAYGATENDLRGLFARHGAVESAVVRRTLSVRLASLEKKTSSRL